MLETNTVVAYGVGKSFFSYLERLEQYVKISYFSDKNKTLYGKKVYGDERKCISIEEIVGLEKPYVIIMIDVPKIVDEVGKKFEDLGIPYIHAREILEYYAGVVDYKINWPTLSQRNKIHRFIDLNMHGTTMCNFHCEYCYVWRREEFKTGNKLSEHSVQEIREGLSLERTGGVCFINMCARGETMLSQDIVDLVRQLLEEGHYVSVVTNGTVTNKINEILNFPEPLQERMFFKLSFHYNELKRLNLFTVFWKNVNNIRASKCSYTLEVTPGDGTIEYIEEMKKMFQENANGLMPHISFTRDSTKVGFDLLSEHSIDEYRQIWGQFDSKMFDLKSRWYGVNMTQYRCYAGNWSYLVNLLTGDIKLCYRKDVVGNIFDKSMKTFPVLPIEHECNMSYCFNNHAFMAWGCVPEVSCYNYLDMRNRQNKDGEVWVKESMASAMAQKLNENNYEHFGKWYDYGKIYQRDRKPAIVLLNSPDYSNLGDHAIAMGERIFFEKYFPEYDVIEISCTEYMKENLRIKPAILKEDILFVTGGGYIGSAWLRMSDMASHIIQTYSDNKVIILPQTMFFENNRFGQSEKERIKEIYTQKKDMLIAAREEKTYDLLKEMFAGSVRKEICPDMALLLHDLFRGEKKREGALICIREDQESTGVDSSCIKACVENLGIESREFSTVVDYEVVLNNRESALTECLAEIASAKVVITDRLHCMIFCAITNTPCVVMDNLNGKVFAVKKRLTKFRNITSCVDVQVLPEQIQQVLKNEVSVEDAWEDIERSISKFAEAVKKYLEA